jgi:hypothetical protein
MSRSRSSCPNGRLRPMLVALGLLVAVTLCGGRPSLAGWRPTPGQRFDIQLVAPFDLIRPADVVALPLFGTLPTRLQELRSRGVAAVCHVMAGAWESWRPDAGQFPQPVVGRPTGGRADQRWLDIRQASLRPVLERRVDLCRDRGFDGVLFAGLDGYARNSGFDLTAEQQLAFNRWLAEVAHARGLAAGIINDLDQAGELANAFDFLVADTCIAQSNCAAIQPFLAANKPVFLLDYTNVARRMNEHCAAIKEIGVSLIFKTQYLNGKLHRRCP